MRPLSLLRATGRAVHSQLNQTSVRPKLFCALPSANKASFSSILHHPLSNPIGGLSFLSSSDQLSLAQASSVCPPTFAPSAAQMSADVAPATNDAEVFGVRRGNAAFAVLNRPKALNALNLNMVQLLQGLLEQWEKDPSINLVVVKSDGKGFCSGGDVRTCVQTGMKGNWLEAADFFRHEYVLDYLVATYQKPYVAIINGVCMGGGNGISMHAPFRVVTEKVLWAMPETLIGLHPDVGASYFLPRLPGHLGEYLALTGQRLKAADMVASGLATHAVSSERLPALEDRLASLRVPDLESISLAINEFAEKPHPRELVVLPRQPLIEQHFQCSSVEEIFSSLEKGSKAGNKAEAEWSSETLAMLKKMSPTSLKVSLRSVREGRRQTLAECLEKETRLSYRCVEKTTSPDFYEGVRALLIDKDNNPKFFPPVLADVTAAMVDQHFKPLGDSAHEFPLAELLKSRGK